MDQNSLFNQIIPLSIKVQFTTTMNIEHHEFTIMAQNTRLSKLLIETSKSYIYMKIHLFTQFYTIFMNNLEKIRTKLCFLFLEYDCDLKSAV